MDEKKVQNQQLVNAFNYLRAKRVIKNQQTVATMTNYSFGLVGKYLRGDNPASQDFLTTFERVFQINLEDFEVPYVESPLAKPREFQEYMITITTRMLALQEDLIKTNEDQGRRIEILQGNVNKLQRTVNEMTELLNKLRKK